MVKECPLNVPSNTAGGEQAQRNVRDVIAAAKTDKPVVATPVEHLNESDKPSPDQQGVNDSSEDVCQLIKCDESPANGSRSCPKNIPRALHKHGRKELLPDKGFLPSVQSCRLGQMAANVPQISSAPIQQQSAATSKAAQKLIDELLEKKEATAVQAIDLEMELMVAREVLRKILCRGDCVPMTLSDVIRETTIELRTVDRNEVKLVADGGVFNSTLSLREEHIKAIENFHLASDNSVMFLLSFLTSWRSDSALSVYLVDPILT